MTVEITDPIEGPPLIDYIAENLPVSKVATITLAALDIWVDPINGDDSNSGLIQTEPIQTPLRADEMIPSIVDHRVTIHLASGDHVLPARGWWLTGRWLRNGWFRVMADEAWDSAVYTLDATGLVLDAGSDHETILVAGTGGSWLGHTIEMLDGAAAGHRRMLADTNANELHLAAPFDSSNAPVPGDSFRVFIANGCRLVLPGGGPIADGQYVLAQTMVGLGASPGRANNIYKMVSFQNGVLEPFGRLVFEGVQLAVTDGLTSWSSFRLQKGLTCFYGVTTDESNDAKQTILEVHGGHLCYGLGAGARNAAYPTVYSPYRGWGFYCRERAPYVHDGVIDGFYSQQTTLNWDMDVGSRSHVILRGGWIGRLSSSMTHDSYFELRWDDQGFSNIRPRTDLGTFSFLQWETAGGLGAIAIIGWMDCIGMNEPFLVEGPGRVIYLNGGDAVRLNRATPGQTVVQVERGAELIMAGSPDPGLTRSTVGTPLTDWTIDGYAFDPLLINAVGVYTRESLGGAAGGGSRIVRAWF